MKKLKIDPTKLSEELIISDADAPLNVYKLKFMQTGEYLRPHDMRYCIEKTNFTESQIIDWFRRFKTDCPDGRLTKDHLRSLFRMAFPEGSLLCIVIFFTNITNLYTNPRHFQLKRRTIFFDIE